MIELLNTSSDCSIEFLCSCARVSRSGWYKWSSREMSDADRVWLRLTDDHDNIFGWVNAAYCNTKHVEFH